MSLIRQYYRAPLERELRHGTLGMVGTDWRACPCTRQSKKEFHGNRYASSGKPFPACSMCSGEGVIMWDAAPNHCLIGQI